LTSQEELAGQAIAVIDVLRASTTIAAALAAGAVEIVPCLDVHEARSLARERPGALLGGERKGEQIPGFDLDNSPLQYTRQRVGGHTLVFTTTNGTRALAACVAGFPVYVAGFVNLTVITAALAVHRQIHLLCAGTDSQVTREDVLLAGALVSRLRQIQAYTLNDSARLAEEAWQASGQEMGSAEALAQVLRDSQGGRNLVRLGREEDILWAASIDRTPVLAELDRTRWTIRLAHSPETF
jgi:2-phosphosulfolactate phosphatase